MKVDDLSKSVKKIRELSKGFEKGDPFIPELLEEIRDLKAKMTFLLEEDERKKAQKKAS